MLFHDCTFTAEQDRYIQVCNTTLLMSKIFLLRCLQYFSVPSLYYPNFNNRISNIVGAITLIH